MVDGIGRYRDDGRPLLAWLYTIARNLLVDLYRRNGRATLDPLTPSLRASTGDPESAAWAQLDRERLVKALARLTDDQRQVIVARFIEERPTAEVAVLMGKTEGSVKALQHRALGALRRVLEKDQNHGS
jgi:RNA polymerase sigma-70 factor (ECF subfamily)